MRARRALCAGVAAAALLALAACTPSSTDPTPPPTSPTVTPAPSSTTTPEPPPDQDPMVPDDLATVGAQPTTWADGTLVDLVPLDPGLARRLDAASLRTVARPQAADGNELVLLGLGDDGSALVADATQATNIDEAESRTTRLRFEGPGGARELDPRPGDGRFYDGRVLDGGGALGFRYSSEGNFDGDVLHFRAGENRSERIDLQGGRILDAGVLGVDGSLTTWDGKERPTGFTTTPDTADVLATECSTGDCFWSTRYDESVEAFEQSGALVRTVDGSAEVVAHIPANALLIGADGDTVVLHYYVADEVGWRLAILDVAARTARTVAHVGVADLDDGRLAWSGIDPLVWNSGEGGGRASDVHVLDLATGALVRIPLQAPAYQVFARGTHLAWTLVGESQEDPVTHGVVVDLPATLLAG